MTKKTVQDCQLTEAEIDSMPPGIELDGIIARLIFKAIKPTPEQIAMIKAISFQFGRWSPGDTFADTILIEPMGEVNTMTGVDFIFLQPRSYSADRYHAFSIIDRLRFDGWKFSLIDMPEPGLVRVRFFKGDGRPQVAALAGSDALAICRAALKTAILNP